MQIDIDNGILKLVVNWKSKRGFLAMQVNDLGFVASILFVLVPAVFLIILYIQTASRQG